MSSLRERDPNDVRLAALAPQPLRSFNDAGVLSSADVQVARTLTTLAGVQEPDVLLAAALAARAPRLGHVLVDIATIADTVAVDTEEPVELAELDWPNPNEWVQALAASPLVTDAPHPMRLEGTRLYLDRYWREEREVAARLRALAAAPAAGDGDDPELLADIEQLYAKAEDERSREAILSALTRRLTIIAGGPGTGKTRSIASIVTLLAKHGRAWGQRPPLIALAAPTGKAAARLGEVLAERAETPGLDPDVCDALALTSARTLHRLLGSRADSRGRFRHDRRNRLPHDVVIVDETSMVSLTLMARLLEALGDEARLVLVGDPDQLSSIEAGAVLGDVAAAAPDDGSQDRGSVLVDSVFALEHTYRFGEGIATLADAVRRGDADGAITALGACKGDVIWIAEDAHAIRGDPALDPVREAASAAGRAVIAAARDGDAPTALHALGEFRLLCAHRRGPYGVSSWMASVEMWLAHEISAAGGPTRDYPGRPLLITANDYDLNLFNGDSGVVVLGENGRLAATFEQHRGVTRVRPSQLSAVETVYAMTVHKSQGSQFATAAVVLPPASSRILTRELLYTALTRARNRLLVVGTEDTIRAAVDRPAARASGLRDRLLEDEPQ
jgi:exodeoxyribonuclease V alpha subunit